SNPYPLTEDPPDTPHVKKGYIKELEQPFTEEMLKFGQIATFDRLGLAQMITLRFCHVTRRPVTIGLNLIEVAHSQSNPAPGPSSVKRIADTSSSISSYTIQSLDSLLQHLCLRQVTAIQQQNCETPKEPQSQKEEFPPAPSDHQSILVSLSSRSVWKGTVCERSHLFRIKYYGSFNKSLGLFLRDHLFDQGYRCRSCEMPSEAHVHCTLIDKAALRYLSRSFKIISYLFPPATLRVVMSDAAWGLSFGKFLELSFSNHAAASRVACCGHSLHRDCLRFYGFGNMVACFRYATIDVNSVYLPPSVLSFNYDNQDWIQRETDEVVERAELLFSELLNAISQIAAKGLCVETAAREKAEFEGGEGRPTSSGFLELYRLRRQLISQSYMWDHRLINASSLSKIESSDENEKVPLAKSQTLPEMNAGTNSLLSGSEVDQNPDGGSTDDTKVQKEADTNLDLNPEKKMVEKSLPARPYLIKVNSMFAGQSVDGEIVMKNLSATLDAAWIGERQTSGEIPTNTKILLPPSNFSTFPPIDLPEQQNEFKVAYPVSPALPSKDYESSEYSVSWLGVPFLNFYRSINKNFLLSSQKLDTFGEHSLSIFHLLERQSFKVDEGYFFPMIAYALTSPEYQRQISLEGESRYKTQTPLKPPLMGSFRIPLSGLRSFFQSDLNAQSNNMRKLHWCQCLTEIPLHHGWNKTARARNKEGAEVRHSLLGVTVQAR
ncbi:hypothetical protein HID58_096063, partial [Brassica napus]